jgi:hypothetical protein
MAELKPGKYRHYKGGLVQVLGVAHSSENLEDVVIYIALYECRDFGIGSVWARPKKSFLEKVVVGKRKVPRFKRVG